jgi:bifunctional DNA-binding transcriptional regulator/antitoxin component of YhaV-PrlF toxin-antitoxin module
MNKNDPRFDVVLDASDPAFPEQLRAALGLAPGEQVEIITPQFERTDGVVVRYCPHTFEEYAALPTYSEATLKKMGCGKWDSKNGITHWLFPWEWYNYIPEGLEILSISGRREQFKPGITDDDKRFGCLAYGFEAQTEEQP